MNIALKVYETIVLVIGHLTIIWFILGIIVFSIKTIKEKKNMKKKMDDFKEAISKSGMGKDLNKPLTEEEKKILKETGHLEYSETINMETLNVTKERKTNNEQSNI